jgi:hypothetical protein
MLLGQKIQRMQGVAQAVDMDDRRRRFAARVSLGRTDRRAILAPGVQDGLMADHTADGADRQSAERATPTAGRRCHAAARLPSR